MKRFTGFLMIIFLCNVFAMGQGNLDTKEIFLEAEYYILYEDYKEALPLYKRLLNAGLDNAYINYRVGECYINIPGQKPNAINYLQKASTDISPKSKEGSFKETQAPIQSVFLLGWAYQINNQLEKAIETYKEYKKLIDIKDIAANDFVNHQIETCENAIELIKNPIKVRIENLGQRINSSFPDIRPVVTPDEKILLFTSELRFYDAVFYTKKEDKWSMPLNLTPQLQTDGDFYTSSISADGQILMLLRKDPFSGDIYQSKLIDGQWSIPEILGKNINTRNWETHAVLSKDKKRLYFTSVRKDGFGGLDIYYSDYNETEDTWGPAINLGPAINTPFDEETPFISEDGTTLYFSSKGHYNMGGYDIFYSKQINENEWSTPINIGYPINTTDDDIFFVPVKNGQYAYTSKFTREGYGQEDIIRYELFSSDNPFKVRIKGKIILEDNRYDFNKENFNIKIIDSSNIETLAILHPQELTGEFNCELRPGTYKFIFNSEDYKRKVATVYIPEDYARNDYIINVSLTPSEVFTGEYVIIKSVFFDFDDYSLTREAKIELEKLYNLMDKYPGLYIEVIGHTDAIGSNTYNYKLSVKRARSVIDYLTGKGINLKRFVAKGFGKNQPIAVNENADGSDNPEGRKYNRRVEMKILKTDKKLILQDDFDIPEYLKAKDLSYTIFLMISEEEMPASFFKQFDELKDYQINEYKGLNYIYTLGEFKEKSEIIKLFNTILDIGFTDAEILDSYKLKELTNHGKYSYLLEDNDESEFTIQLMATKTKIDLSYFNDLDVIEIECKDGFFRYIYGTYETAEDAEEDMNQMLEQGFNEAIIMNKDNLKAKK